MPAECWLRRDSLEMAGAGPDVSNPSLLAGAVGAAFPAGRVESLLPYIAFLVSLRLAAPYCLWNYITICCGTTQAVTCY